MINDENLIKRNDCSYILNDAVVKEKIIKKYYANLLLKHFKTQKTLNLIQRKYYQVVCSKQIKTYVKTYNVCQRIKAFRHKSYEKLNLLFIFKIL